jgi:hypothetical protein
LPEFRPDNLKNPALEKEIRGDQGMGVPVYFYGTHTATVSGSRMRRERCTACSTVFEYQITRQVQGGGHSPFFLNGAGAAASAKMRAHANLNRALDEVEPVHCPACGIFQPDMVQVLHQRHGKRYEPNKYASERIAVPEATAWRLAREADSVEAYTKFMEVWPYTYSWHLTSRSDELLFFMRWYARQRLKVLKYPLYLRKIVQWYARQQIKVRKYPPHLRKTISSFFWIVWAAVGLSPFVFYFMTSVR